MRINNAIEKVYIIFFVILIMSKFKPKNVYIFGGAIQLNQTVQLNIWPQFNETEQINCETKSCSEQVSLDTLTKIVCIYKVFGSVAFK